MVNALRAAVRNALPHSVYNHYLNAISDWSDVRACATFLLRSFPNASLAARTRLIRSLYKISASVTSPHTQKEVLRYIQAILELPPSAPGVVVEAGCWRGSSTAKFSLAAALAGRELVVFDSFQGLPSNQEAHDKNIYGGWVQFREGDLCAPLNEVKTNVSRFGDISRCRFVQGWFADTLPSFHERVAAIYLDVDLVSSTQTCLKYLYPLLEPGGTLCSQDGHLPLVIELLDDDDFWRSEVGCEKPEIFGLGTEKLVTIIKPAK